MTITTLDARTALIVIDLQQGVVALPTAHPTAEVIANAARLASAFRARGLPVVLVNVVGGAPGRADQFRKLEGLPPQWAELVPQLSAQADDVCISKRTWGAFSQPDLLQALQARAVTQVVIVGISTSIGVESTARQAHELGLNVSLAIDAMTDLHAQAHQNSIERIFPRLGETGTTQDILDHLPPLGAGLAQH